MNLLRHPDLVERLAASYALGTLRGGARRRFEALAREQAPLRAAALVWQGRLSGMAELQPQVAPSPVVWQRIENVLAAEREQQAMGRQRDAAHARAATAAAGGGWWRNLLLWRGASLAAALVAVLAVLVVVQQRERFGTELAGLRDALQTAPRVEYVAVLEDDQSAASMLVTFDPRNRRLTLKRVGGYQEAADKSLQLWALPPGGAPRSLGVLGTDPVLRLAAAEAAVQGVPALAISLEPKGGVPGEGGPTGPVLFKGALLQAPL